VRRMVQSAVARGRVELSVSLSPVASGTLPALSFDMSLAREYTEMARKLADELKLEGGPSLGWVLAQPGVISGEAEPTLSADEAWPLLDQALSRALGDLSAHREAEGAALSQELLHLHAELGTHVGIIAQLAPDAAERRAGRLRTRIQGMLGEST